MTNATKHPLANDANGNPLDVPPEAVGWRVRKLARKAGRPKVLFDTETGRPLEVPLAITCEDFAETVGESGRYRLEAFDGQGRLILGCIAVTEVVFDDEDEVTRQPQNAAEALPHLIQLVGKLVESNARVMETMASAFGQVHPSQAPVVIERAAPSKNEDDNTLPKVVAALMQQFGPKLATIPVAETMESQS